MPVTIADLIAAEDTLVIDRRRSDALSYPTLVSYFQQIPIITAESMTIGIHMAYGWMPTIFEFRHNEWDGALMILNRAKSGHQLNVRDIDTLKNLFHNSVVGSSKLLHFIRPDRFPIWDSLVCDYVKRHDAHWKGDETVPSGYIRYMALCANLSACRGFRQLHHKMDTQFGYHVTAYRAIEFIMYEGERRYQRGIAVEHRRE